MTNLERANQIALELYEDEVGYFADIKPLIVYGEPQLAHSYRNHNNHEVFLYNLEDRRKFYIKIIISKEGSVSTSHPRFEITKPRDSVVNGYLSKYPPYLSPNESLRLFIENDLPKIADHKRDKSILINCWTDYGQGNVGHFELDHEFLKLLTLSGLFITYAVQVQK